MRKRKWRGGGTQTQAPCRPLPLPRGDRASVLLKADGAHGWLQRCSTPTSGCTHLKSFCTTPCLGVTCRRSDRGSAGVDGVSSKSSWQEPPSLPGYTPWALEGPCEAAPLSQANPCPHSHTAAYLCLLLQRCLARLDSKFNDEPWQTQLSAQGPVPKQTAATKGRPGTSSHVHAQIWHKVLVGSDPPVSRGRRGRSPSSCTLYAPKGQQTSLYISGGACGEGLLTLG